ncbi:MAG: hypothetical protein K6F87_09055 [Lachnospiraceae bacterium]|nr:hypothetical protein [Lachnospiraceae bacterium]
MSGLLSTLIVIIAFFMVITKVLKNAASDTAKTKTVRGAVRTGKPAPRYTNYRPHKDIISVSRDMGDSKGNSTLRDDRANDWLARQLREEHKAFKATSEMFDLKIEHASHCDARLLEQFHKNNCTANGIDLGNGSTVQRKPG